MRRIAAWVCLALLLWPLLLTSSRAVPASGPGPATPARAPTRTLCRHWVFDARLGRWQPVAEATPPASRQAASRAQSAAADFPIATAAGWQMDPAVAFNPARDEFLAVWEDLRNGSDLDIYGQRFGADGRLLGSNFALVIGQFDQESPSLFYTPAVEGYCLLWHHHEPAHDAIYVQHLSSTGTPLGSPIAVPTPAQGQQWIPGAAYNETLNEFLVAWEDMSTGAILAQRISASGAAVGSTIFVSGQPGLQWTPPRVTFNDVWEEYLVVWDDLNGGDIYGQIVMADGVLRGDDLAITTADGRQFVSGVIYNSARDVYLVLWTDERDLATNDADVYAQRVSGGGIPMPDEMVISAAPGGQRNCVGVYDPAHEEYLLVWWDGRTSNTASDIYGQRVSTEGPLLGPNLPISAKASDQVYPCLAHRGGSDQYAIVWQEWYETEQQEIDADLYGMLYAPQRFCAYFPHCAAGQPDPGLTQRSPIR